MARDAGLHGTVTFVTTEKIIANNQGRLSSPVLTSPYLSPRLDAELAKNTGNALGRLSDLGQAYVLRMLQSVDSD
jgi:hypothetical protein